MNFSRVVFVNLAAVIVNSALIVTTHAANITGDKTKPINFTGPHGFDFEIGAWQVHHRLKRKDQWVEMDGTCIDRAAMDGSANIEEHTFNRQEGVTRGMAVRTYDTKTGLWAIWWVDSRDPHGAMDPPVKGKFENGIGTFYSDSVVNGQTIRTRFLWSHITATTARWEQATSSDTGKTWDTNWIMEFVRK